MHLIDVGDNFGRINLCPLGCIALDDQKHIFQCSQLKDKSNEVNNFNYADIFSEKSSKFVSATNLADMLLRKREEKQAKIKVDITKV